MLSFSHETSIETFKSTEELLIAGLRRPVAPHTHLGFAHYVTGSRGNERGEPESMVKRGRPPQSRTTSFYTVCRNAAAENKAANTNGRVRRDVTGHRRLRVMGGGGEVEAQARDVWVNLQGSMG